METTIKDPSLSRHRRGSAKEGRRSTVELSIPWTVAKWVVTISIFAVMYLWGHFAMPYCRSFSWDDATIAHKHKPNTFPTASLFPIATIPAVLGLVMTVNPIFRRWKWYEFHEIVFMTMLSVALTSVLNDPLKMYAGRLRPDFLARLEAAGYNRTFPNPATFDYCSLNTDHTLRDGRQSFPSGHSSYSFAAMVLTSILLFNRLRVFSRTDWKLGTMVVSLSPLVLCFIVAISRTRDNRHHFTDIAAGAALGTFSAFLSFFMHFTYSDKYRMYIPALFVPEIAVQLPSEVDSLEEVMLCNDSAV